MASLSFSLGGSSSNPTQRQAPPPPRNRTNGTKREHAALLDDNSDSDDEINAAKRQTITHFDASAGGAVNATAAKREEKKPLVIAALANRDWREASKRQRAQKYGITEQFEAAKGEERKDAEGADRVVREKEGVKYGLNVFEAGTSASVEETQEAETEQQEQERRLEKTADQLAIDALTGAAPTSTLTIPSAVTEQDAFTDSYHSAPPAPSLSDYAAVPVEEYGAAMLRGMGWKGPSSAPSTAKSNKKTLPPAKRPALLGIGADPNAAAQAEELGAWGKSSGRGRKEPTMFVPVSMKHKRTGETLTEDELKDKIRREKEQDAETSRFAFDELEIRDKKRERRDEGARDGKARDDASDYDQERRRKRRDRKRESHRHERSKDHDRRDGDGGYSSKDRDGRSEYDKSSSRRRRSRDRDYDRRDRDREYDRRDRDRDHDRRDRYDEAKSSRKDRYDDDDDRSSRRDRDSHRSSRR